MLHDKGNQATGISQMNSYCKCHPLFLLQLSIAYISHIEGGFMDGFGKNIVSRLSSAVQTTQDLINPSVKINRVLDEELNELAGRWPQYHIRAPYPNTEKDGIVRAGYTRTGLKIGKGESGVVEIIKNHQRMYYALKTITRKDIADNGEEAVKIVVNEIDILSMVQQNACPSVIHFEGFTSDNENVYLIFEHAYGGNFDDVLASVSHYNENTRNIKHKAFDEDEAGLYLIQLAEGLSCLEKHRIEHRDLKPDNLLLDKDGNLKIADFGLARHHSLTNTLTPESFHANAYAPPEIIDKALKDDKTPLTSKWHRYDWWAFGVLMYEFVMGFRPFNEETLEELHESIIKHQLTFPTTHPSNKYQNLVAMLLKVNVRFGYPQRPGENRWKILIEQITEITQNVGNGERKNTDSANTQQLATKNLQGKEGPYILMARSHKSQVDNYEKMKDKTLIPKISRMELMIKRRIHIAIHHP